MWLADMSLGLVGLNTEDILAVTIVRNWLTLGGATSPRVIKALDIWYQNISNTEIKRYD